MPRPNATALSAPRASVHPSRRSLTPCSTSWPYARAMPSDTSAYASRLTSPSSRAMVTASSLDAIPAVASPPTAHMKPRRSSRSARSRERTSAGNRDQASSRSASAEAESPTNHCRYITSHATSIHRSRSVSGSSTASARSRNSRPPSSRPASSATAAAAVSTARLSSPACASASSTRSHSSSARS